MICLPSKVFQEVPYFKQKHDKMMSDNNGVMVLDDGTGIFKFPHHSIVLGFIDGDKIC